MVDGNTRKLVRIPMRYWYNHAELCQSMEAFANGWFTDYFSWWKAFHEVAQYVQCWQPKSLRKNIYG